MPEHLNYQLDIDRAFWRDQAGAVEMFYKRPFVGGSCGFYIEMAPSILSWSAPEQAVTQKRHLTVWFKYAVPIALAALYLMFASGIWKNPTDPAGSSFPKPCTTLPVKYTYCEEQVFDDGVVRTYLSKPDNCKGCCLITRSPVDGGHQTRTIVKPIGGNILACKDYGGVSKTGSHIIDGTETYVSEE